MGKRHCPKFWMNGEGTHWYWKKSDMN